MDGSAADLGNEADEIGKSGDVSLRQILALASCLAGTAVIIWNATVVANASDNAKVIGVSLSLLYPIFLFLLGLFPKESSVKNLSQRLVHGLISYGGRDTKTLLSVIGLNLVCGGVSWLFGHHAIATVSCNEKGFITTGQSSTALQSCQEDTIARLWMPWMTSVSFRSTTSDKWKECRSGKRGSFECAGNIAVSARPGHGALPGPHILVVRSGELEFTRTIYQGLRDTLSEASFTERVGPTTSTTEAPADWQRLIQEISEIPDPEPYDYLVGVGTQASMALHDARRNGKLKSRKGLVFLGVTNPVEANLVRSIHHREDAETVGGVRYGSDTSDLVARVFDAFPGPRKIFFFRKTVPQDVAIAKDIRALREDVPEYKGKLDVLELSDWPKLADFTDPDALYFSWYTMDLMLAEHLGYDIVKKRIVVASTGALVEDERIAAAAIAVNDFEIGKEGAGIIRKDWSGQTSLGFQDVAEPSFRLWIDCASLRAKGIDDVRARVHADVTVGCQ